MNNVTRYNIKQAARYDWGPELFGCKHFDEELNDAIRQFQRESGLQPDGMCGPSTYRRRFNDIESSGDFTKDHSIQEGDKFIIHNGNATEIFWDKVVLWTDAPGFKARSFRNLSGSEERKPKMFVTHWDVCLNSTYCQKVLNKRGLSVHFLIDNDGTIIQTLDTQHVGYHAGSRHNSSTIGVEVSSAHDLKWQSWYERNGFGPRPIVKNAKCHGRRLNDFLGFYDVQEQALAALWEATSHAANIPLELPRTKDTVDTAVQAGGFRGFVNHYHITNRKIDCAGLDNERIMSMAHEIRRKRQ